MVWLMNIKRKKVNYDLASKLRKITIVPPLCKKSKRKYKIFIPRNQYYLGFIQFHFSMLVPLNFFKIWCEPSWYEHFKVFPFPRLTFHGSSLLQKMCILKLLSVYRNQIITSFKCRPSSKIFFSIIFSNGKAIAAV